MGRATFANLLKDDRPNPRHTSNRKRSSISKRAEDEDMPMEETDAVGESTTTEGVPEDAVEIDAKVYTTENGDLLIIPSEPLTVEGVDEPLEEISISLIDELEEEGLDENPAPADLVTDKPAEDDFKEAEAEELQAGIEAEAIMAKLNSADTKTSFFKGGSAENPKWFVTANGDMVATIAYSAIPDESGKFKEFFASDNFPTKVHESAKVIGWDTVLANFKAEIFTKKSKVVAPEKVNHQALRAEVTSQIKNDLSLAYSAMTSRLRSNPFAAHLFDAIQQSGMEAPEVFTAAVIEKSAQEFVTQLADVLDEVAGMSESVKAEFKQLISRTTVPLQESRKYTPDQSFMAKLQDHSVPVSSTNPSSKTSRLRGIL